ncbi:2796_t:CDS:2, partial [Cetraspora pellucida]
SNLTKQTDQFDSNEDFNTFVEDCINIPAILVKDQQEYDDETTSSSSSNKENFIVVENPILYPKKGAPRKKQFKASNELEK